MNLNIQPDFNGTATWGQSSLCEMSPAVIAALSSIYRMDMCPAPNRSRRLYLEGNERLESLFFTNDRAKIEDWYSECTKDSANHQYVESGPADRLLVSALLIDSEPGPAANVIAAFTVHGRIVFGPMYCKHALLCRNNFLQSLTAGNSPAAISMQQAELIKFLTELSSICSKAPIPTGPLMTNLVPDDMWIQCPDGFFISVVVPVIAFAKTIEGGAVMVTYQTSTPLNPVKVIPSTFQTKFTNFPWQFYAWRKAAQQLVCQQFKSGPKPPEYPGGNQPSHVVDAVSMLQAPHRIETTRVGANHAMAAMTPDEQARTGISASANAILDSSSRISIAEHANALAAFAGSLGLMVSRCTREQAGYWTRGIPYDVSQFIIHPEWYYAAPNGALARCREETIIRLHSRIDGDTLALSELKATAVGLTTEVNRTASILLGLFEDGNMARNSDIARRFAAVVSMCKEIVTPSGDKIIPALVINQLLEHPDDMGSLEYSLTRINHAAGDLQVVTSTAERPETITQAEYLEQLKTGSLWATRGFEEFGSLLAEPELLRKLTTPQTLLQREEALLPLLREPAFMRLQKVDIATEDWRASTQHDWPRWSLGVPMAIDGLGAGVSFCHPLVYEFYRPHSNSFLTIAPPKQFRKDETVCTANQAGRYKGCLVLQFKEPLIYIPLGMRWCGTCESWY